MSEIIITSYFASNGVPSIGLTPSLRIWEITNNGQDLIIGDSEGTGNAGPAGGGNGAGSTGVDGVMVEVVDNSASDGFYRYTFDEFNGYDPLKCYVFRVDGGDTLNPSERYQAGELSIEQNAEALVDLIYNEPANEHIVTGSFGEVINQINATTAQTFMDLGDVMELVELVRKYNTNRTRVDMATNQLTVYDDDCVTPLRVFNMLNGNGEPSLSEMCERVPTAASDGQPVC